mmetsp:Transcript_1266/g.2311  ORF Transcript_1266/g.2311 Transcript_1266/m.2311 type:complete len:133 (-) Transcript_1266:73-471(-)
MAAASMAPIGVENMAGMQQIAERVNFGIFQGLPEGGAVRIAGNFDNERKVLTPTDGGAITLTSDSPVDLSPVTGFAEVVGTKAADGSLRAVGVVPFPAGAVDVELWNEAVKLAHLPQMRDLLQPVRPAVGGE